MSSITKGVLLQGLKGQLRQQVLSELDSDKLHSPANLDTVCNRLISALRGNAFTCDVLKALKVEDSELCELLRGVLTEVGVELQ